MNTTVTVLIAFGVVVLTTLGNSLLEWFKQHLANRHAATILRRALLEELKQARDTAKINVIRSENPEQGGSFLIPVAQGHRVYDANISNLGRLKPAEVSAVVHAYGMLEAQVETLAVIGTFHRNDGPILQAVVDAKWSEVLANNGQSLIDALEAAVATLEGLKPVAGSPPGQSSPRNVTAIEPTIVPIEAKDKER